MVIWKWNDVELDIDMGDADFQKKYEEAFKKAEEEEKKVVSMQGTENLYEFTVKYCNIYYNLFDNIYGAGTAEKIFKGKRNCTLAEEVYVSWLNQCKKDIDEINKRRVSMFGKFNVKAKR